MLVRILTKESYNMSKQDKKETLKAKIEKKSFFSNISLSLFLLIVGLLSASYLTTETLDFGGQMNKARAALARALEPRYFTVDELAKYDGSDPDLPIYLSVNGKVYDVTKGKDYYGKGGSYAFFAGKDASRAYITGCFKEHLTHDLRGLSKKQLTGLQNWIDLYEKSPKYFFVGIMKFKPLTDDDPIPKPC